MLGLSPGEKVILLLEEAEKFGLDVISCGVALAWATEAYQKGLLGEKKTLFPLAFGEAEGYRKAIGHIALRTNEFYRLLGEGTAAAAARYGGEEFACLLGQEMAGYATGPVFFVSQALGFRFSHLDSAGYQIDQQKGEITVEEAQEALVKEEEQRFLLTCMVACLFARNIYDPETLAEALEAAGLASMAQDLEAKAALLYRMRWKLKKACGFDPLSVKIPPRFYSVKTWRGPLSTDFMEKLLALHAGYLASL